MSHSRAGGDGAPVDDGLYLTRLQQHLLRVHDEKIHRCTHCGEWVYGKQDCSVCLLPHSSTIPDSVAS
jgi:hypothetical protein